MNWEALRESIRRFRLVADNLRDAVFHADLSGRATYVNSSYTGMFGYSLEEAMPDGGIVYIGAENRTISERSTLPLEKGNYVEITLKDRGMGISSEYLDRVFDPYFTTKQKGSGLGLVTLPTFSTSALEEIGRDCLDTV